MCFVWIWEQTAIISLYSINWLVSVTESVFTARYGLGLSTIQCLTQQIVNSIISNHLSLMFLLHVSTSTRSSSERYTQSQTSTANSIKRWACVESNTISWIKITKTVWSIINSRTFLILNNTISSTADEHLCQFCCHLHSKGISLCWVVGVGAMVDRWKMYNQSIARNTEYVKSECLYVFNCTITLTLSLALTLNSKSPAKGTSFDSSGYLFCCVKIRHTDAGLQVRLSYPKHSLCQCEYSPYYMRHSLTAGRII
jgi:hypothetical protein